MPRPKKPPARKSPPLNKHVDENSAAGATATAAANGTVTAILLAISFSHLLNDTIQSLIPAIYPFLKDSFRSSYTQIGLITLAFQLTASLLQPVVGIYTDRQPEALLAGRSAWASRSSGSCSSRFASTFAEILLAAALVGLGSAVFHPESSRVARMASGGRYGLAQSIFQVGGNVGSALGPLAAAFIVMPGGQGSIAWFSLVALLAIFVLSNVGALVRAADRRRTSAAGKAKHRQPARLSSRARDGVARGPARPDLLEVLLHGLPDAAITPSSSSTSSASRCRPRSSISSSSSPRSRPAPSSAVRSATASGARS